MTRIQKGLAGQLHRITRTITCRFIHKDKDENNN
jgi:hypothetical protein